MRPNIPPEKFVEWLKNLPEEERRLGNEKEAERTEEDYKRFVECFNKGDCSICKKPLKTFSAGSPCLHWLLRPKKFKKKHFPLLYEEFTYFRISAYVRWVASIESPLRNINDIVEEHPGEKIIDFTAKYKHITWSFSCGKSDLEGHKGKRHGNSPHYHMQMTLNRQRFISYNDFHIPFHSDDLYDLELFTNHSDIVKHGYGRGTGMQEILGNEKTLELLVDESEATDNPEEAAFNLNTIIMAKEGETISGELLAEAFDEAKAKGKTATSVLREKLKDTGAGITTIVFPGDGVPEPQQRRGRSKNKN
jgi:hypothetical protein